jgi:hypothetical protein
MSFVTINSALRSITINSKTLTDVGVHDITLIAEPVTFGVSYKVPFKVTMVHICQTA